MGLKQLSFFGAFLILAVLLLLNVNFVSAQACYITSEANCLGNSDYIAARLSGTTNAHTSLESQSNFPGNNVLCCDFGGGGTTCDGNNKFLGISSSSNAHVERPELNPATYATDACYAGFINALSSTSNPSGDFIPILSIFSESNAHSAQSGDYSWVVYAEPVFLPADCELTSASWDITEIGEGSDAGFTVAGTDQCSEVPVELSLKVTRNDGQACSDIVGCTNPSNVVFGPNGTATGSWTARPAHSENYTFTATVVGNPTETRGSSNELRVLEGSPQWCEDKPVVICEDYDTQSECGADQCGVAENSVPESVDCSDPDVICDCEWNSQKSLCEASWEGSASGSGGAVGKCTYEQSITSQCDEEPVGQLSFSWTATWTWDPGCDATCQQENAGLEAQCVDGSRVVECPAQIPLPFFNAFGFLITILLVAAVYMILNSRKPGKKKRKNE